MSSSEDRYRESRNRCFADAIVKTAGGIVMGATVALLFLRRRRWPVWIGAGFGIGLAYRSCERNMKALK
ncbi:MICOS complex subunit Mic10-like [Drosophila obscura]|uniref:MICOS complex subunit Mic10-like n=1 Tax=Drosophila obscura TaxID=7282 RepID=UPI000BA15F1F|nr:MICOS complex subunit Mic10-like [Drosophila obscura]